MEVRNCLYSEDGEDMFKVDDIVRVETTEHYCATYEGRIINIFDTYIELDSSVKYRSSVRTIKIKDIVYVELVNKEAENA